MLRTVNFQSGSKLCASSLRGEPGKVVGGLIVKSFFLLSHWEMQNFRTCFQRCQGYVSRAHRRALRRQKFAPGEVSRFATVVDCFSHMGLS